MRRCSARGRACRAGSTRAGSRWARSGGSARRPGCGRTASATRRRCSAAPDWPRCRSRCPPDPWCSPPERSQFLEASESAVADERAARVHRNRRRRLIIAAMTALAVLASGLAVFAFVSGRSAATEQRSASAFRDLALAGELLDAADRIRPLDANVAAQLTIVAYRTSPTTQGRPRCSTRPPNRWSPGCWGPRGRPCRRCPRTGRILAVADGSNGSIRLLTVTDPAASRRAGHRRAGAPDPAVRGVVQPGRPAARGGESARCIVQLWNVGDPTAPGADRRPVASVPVRCLRRRFSPRTAAPCWPEVRAVRSSGGHSSTRCIRWNCPGCRPSTWCKPWRSRRTAACSASAARSPTCSCGR